MKKIWITWEVHRRTRELASAIPGIKLFEYDLEACRLVRYMRMLPWTKSILIRERPDLVIVQNPSMILTIFTVTMGKLMKFCVVVDAHNEGIMPFYSMYYWLLPIYRLIQRRADLTIVTNEALARIVRKNGGRPFILADKIPQFNVIDENKLNLKGKRNFVFICDIAKDEPWQKIIQCARLIEPSDYIYITGRYQKASSNIIMKAPSNVIFTGFLPDNEYIHLLHSCDVVIDLTLMDDCLVCGAYEAVALGKPVILSDTEALRNYFNRGAVYCRNSVKEIAKAIKYAIENQRELEKEMAILKSQLILEWEKKGAILVQTLEQLSRKRS